MTKTTAYAVIRHYTSAQEVAGAYSTREAAEELADYLERDGAYWAEVIEYDTRDADQVSTYGIPG